MLGLEMFFCGRLLAWQAGSLGFNLWDLNKNHPVILDAAHAQGANWETMSKPLHSYYLKRTCNYFSVISLHLLSFFPSFFIFLGWGLILGQS